MQVTNTVKQMKRNKKCPRPSWRLLVQPNIFHWHSTLQFLTQAVRCIETSIRAWYFFYRRMTWEQRKKKKCSGIFIGDKIVFPPIGDFILQIWFGSWKLAFHFKFTMYSQMILQTPFIQRPTQLHILLRFEKLTSQSTYSLYKLVAGSCIEYMIRI